MSFNVLDTVVLTRDLPEHGLLRGDMGAIVHVHSADSFEVEFVQASGQIQALVSLPADAIRAIQDGDLIAVRQVHQSA